jgi:hypothetical protein
MNPLDWFLLEKNMTIGQVLTLKRETQKLQRAYVAAAALMDDLKMERPKNSIQQGIFLSSEQHKHDVPIVFDTGASMSVTPFEDDFVEQMQPPEHDSLTGLSEKTPVLGQGLVEWIIRDPFGHVGVIRTTAYYVPSAKIRLFSPQKYCMENKKGSKHGGDHEAITFTTATGEDLVFPYQPHSHLPLMHTDDNVPQVGLTKHLCLNLALTNGTSDAHNLIEYNNYNLTKEEKELSLWHQRLSHAGMGWIQDLMKKPKPNVGSNESPPLITTRHPGTASCDIPRCPACLYAKAHRKGAGSQVTYDRPEKIMAIRRDAACPGDQVSIDQCVSNTPGRLPNTYGKEKETDRYHGGTIYVDHYSGYIHLVNQISLRTGETLLGKHDFERFAAVHGISVKSYRADNHPFGSKEFQADIRLHGQTCSFSGVGAHHQNGAAERAIATVVRWSRSAMMNQCLYWPEQFEEHYWPFALEHAVHIWNHIPRDKDGLTPYELFTNTKQPEHKAIQKARVWGCPVYVLDPTLQDGKKLPKWKKRSRCGMYLGPSPVHAESVGRILNLESGAISPQYHVVYDELFSTVPGFATKTIFDHNLWSGLIRRHGEENDFDQAEAKPQEVLRIAKDLFKRFVQDTDPTYRDPDPETSVPEGAEDDDDATSVSEGEPSDKNEIAPVENEPSRVKGPTFRSSQSRSGRSTQTRSGRKVKSREFLQHDPTYLRKKQLGTHHARFPVPLSSNSTAGTLLARHQNQDGSARYHGAKREQYLAGGNPNRKTKDNVLNRALIQGLDWDPSVFLQEHHSSTTQKILQALIADNHLTGEWSPFALNAKAGEEDLPTWEQAMNGPYAEGYWKAAEKEIKTLEDMNVWETVQRQPWMNVLPSTWAFRRKVYPSGEVRKLKARFCARGDRQIYGVDFHDTFAPVVSWTTVRLLLILSAQLGLATRQVDYTAAFVHADIDLPPDYDRLSKEEQDRCGVCVEVPRGFPSPGNVLKLNKSLYGLKQSPRNFFNYLKTKLERVGFVQQIDVDACLFISDKVICLVYVDDTLLYARNSEDIDEVLRRLQEDEGMQLEVEDDVAGFLGVQITRDEESGEVTLTQTGLINRIIEALNIDDLPGVDTPADQCLGKDEDGESPHCTFNYASVIGMMWYLYGHSRPDLGFSVSQAARFAFAPKRSHELALIRIGQYLKKTRDKGMTMKPITSDKFQMDVFVDSDFMGLYGKEKRSDPDNVKSRTGFVICLNGCPIVWASKLQTTISLSTMMAEYYALSTAMREVLPIRDRVKAVAQGFGIDPECVTEFRTTVWEDNNGALSLAQLDPGQHTARSKFFDCKVHWFRSILRPNLISVLKVDTAQQIADLFTKPLTRDTFQCLRKLMIGW